MWFSVAVAVLLYVLVGGNENNKHTQSWKYISLEKRADAVNDNRDLCCCDEDGCLWRRGMESG